MREEEFKENVARVAVHADSLSAFASSPVYDGMLEYLRDSAGLNLPSSNDMETCHRLHQGGMRDLVIGMLADIELAELILNNPEGIEIDYE